MDAIKKDRYLKVSGAIIWIAVTAECSPICPVGFYWMSLLEDCVNCSTICFPGSTYTNSCMELCGLTIPPATSTTIQPITDVVQDDMHGYIGLIVSSIAVLLSIIIVAVIFRKKAKYLVASIKNWICPNNPHLSTEEQHICPPVTEDGRALNHNVNVFVQPNGLNPQNGFRHQNGSPPATASNASNANSASQHLLDADSDNDTTDNDSDSNDNVSSIGSTKVLESKAV